MDERKYTKKYNYKNEPILKELVVDNIMDKIRES